MLGQLSWENEPDGCLDLTGRDSGPLVVVGKPGRLGSDALEDIVDERIHDAHGLGTDAGVRVDLLQDCNHVCVVEVSATRRSSIMKGLEAAHYLPL